MWKPSSFLALLLASAAPLLAAEPVTLALPSGEVVQCVEVRRVFPAAIQFVDSTGQIRLIPRKNIPPESVPKLAALMPAPAAAARPATPTPPPAGPVLYVDVVPVGSKSSTTYHYYDWYGVSRTTNSGATYELRLNLARPKKLTVKVITLVGANFEEHDIPLDQGRVTALRIETSSSRTVTNNYWYTHYAIEKRPRTAWFVQVVCDGKLYAEKGTRPANLETGGILKGPEQTRRQP